MRCVTGFCKTTKAGLGYDNNGHLCPGIAGVKRANIGDFHISMRWPFISLPGDAGQCHRVKMFFRKHSCQLHSRNSACRRWPISGSLAMCFPFRPSTCHQVIPVPAVSTAALACLQNYFAHSRWTILAR